MTTFPGHLFEAEHQEVLFNTLLGDRNAGGYHIRQNPDKPKLVYRSDTSRQIYLMYVRPESVWLAVADPSKEGPVNVHSGWQLVMTASEPMMRLIEAFFRDVEYHVNHGKSPVGRIGAF